LIWLYLEGGSYEIAAMHRLPLGMTEQIPIFLAFMAAFAVKVPMWPVHTWLTDAHVEEPTGGSVILAAIMLKMGGYGFLRFSLPVTPDASRELDWLLITLSLIAIAYIGLVALAQRDMKKLIAYSSIAHMGFVTLGAFVAYDIFQTTGSVSGAAMGLDGAMVQMISHGLVSGALFLCVGVLYDRLHTREITAYGGVVNTMPVHETPIEPERSPQHQRCARSFAIELGRRHDGPESGSHEGPERLSADVLLVDYRHRDLMK
jgi:NADH-quinone oxidoreductase subunit M